ncbi:MAG: hypothetical protein HY866_07430 [Chloroflexi bacterium]|nr:hypothetical protein [Chloroflexota bacterium]
MNESVRQVAPVVISILVIITVAVLRSYSKTLAAITATMPINIPLALWIIYASDNNSQQELSQFATKLLVGLGATVAFTAVMWLAARAGWSLIPMLGVSYLAWALTLGIQYVLRTFVF